MRVSDQSIEPYVKSYVRWNGDIIHIPRCDLCGYEGKEQKGRSVAQAAANQHAITVAHRHARAVRLGALFHRTKVGV